MNFDLYVIFENLFVIFRKKRDNVRRRDGTDTRVVTYRK